MKNYFTRISFILILFSFERGYVVKGDEYALKYDVYNLVSYYLPIEKTNQGTLYLETLPIIVDDIVFELKVYFIYHGYRTYKIVFHYDFYKITPDGLEKTGRANKKVYNLISVIDYEFRQRFRDKIVYDY